MFTKKLCENCSLNGDCVCQTNQKDVDSCGMEKVISYNKKYQTALKAGRLQLDEQGTMCE